MSTTNKSIIITCTCSVCLEEVKHGYLFCSQGCDASKMCKKCAMETIKSREWNVNCLEPECNHAFEMPTLMEIFSAKFISDLRTHKANEKYKTEQWRVNSEKGYLLEAEMSNREFNEEMIPLNNKILILSWELKKLKELRKQKRNEHYKFQLKLVNKENKKGKKKVFVRPCPKDDCEGLVDNYGLCALCLTENCTKCYEEIKGSKKEHECSEENLATVKEILKCTQKCPKCLTRIQKSDGCDQMWCTNCHTAFSYKTGLEEKGHIHNPLYYAHLRDTGKELKRNPGDECGRFDEREFIRTLDIDQSDWQVMVDYPRLMHEIRAFSGEDRSEWFETEDTNKMIDHILGKRKKGPTKKGKKELTKNQMIMRYKRNTKALEKDAQIRAIFLATVDLMEDICTNFSKKKADAKATGKLLSEVITIFNVQMRKLSFLYNQGTYEITWSEIDGLFECKKKMWHRPARKNKE